MTVITGTSGNDTLTGGNGADDITLNGGVDTVFGGGGNDVIRIASTRADPILFPQHQIDGGDGIDCLIIGNEFGRNGIAHLTSANFAHIEEVELESGATADLGAGKFGLGLISTTLKITSDNGIVKIGQQIGIVLDVSGFVIRGKVGIWLYGNVQDDWQRGNDATNDTLLGGVGGNDTLLGLGGNDLLYGGAGNDLLNGGSGRNILRGDAGSDTYVVRAAEQIVIENAREGRDTVLTSVSFVLPVNVEIAVLTGAANRSLTGTAQRNGLTGNLGDNRLSGGGGIDTLDGGAGDDRLTGGRARDVFVFGRGDDRDHITDFSARGAMRDRIDLSDLASITDFRDLRAHHVRQAGADVVINAGRGDVLILTGVHLAELDAGDFLF
jgi:Ca2+-binding RTX toxin-like protein